MTLRRRASPRGLSEQEVCQWHTSCEFRSEPPEGHSYIEAKTQPGGFCILLTTQKYVVAGPEGLTEKKEPLEKKKE